MTNNTIDTISEQITHEEIKSKNSAFNLRRQENGIAHLVMDVVDESMNILKAEFAEQVAAVLAEITRDSSITGLILSSGKKDSFIA
jgi:3-hydroxyacyl-CoA dehydrogenase/enoyl-CoA hydratase/3-hydroxybutyryl-CoA epimerase